MALDAAQLAAENAALRAEVAELRERGAFLEAFYADHATAETPGDSDAEARAAAIEAAEVYVVRLRDLARRGSASDAALALGPNVSLEYTLDSPMFRKSSEAFERTVDGLGDVLRELAKRCRAWAKLQLEADAAAKLVSAFLTSRKHGRALFSGAHASLGSLSERMILFAQDFRAAAERRSAFARCVEASVCDGLIKFCENELGDVKSFSTEVWRLGDVFEGKLCDVLRYADAESLQKNGAATEQLQDARTRFETARFALVRYLNGVDAKKKLALSEALHAASQGLAAESCAFRSDLRLTQRALDVERERAVLDESLWDAVLQRLEAELSGELPPPGAPAGARAETDLTPMPGSREKGAPPWSISLTTEVLSEATLRADRGDLAHARDEGVLKQGYLHGRGTGALQAFASKIGFAAKSREWHRLHNGSLYSYSAGGHSERKVLDLQGCSVHRGRHRAAADGGRGGRGILGATFAFAILKADGHRAIFQAENDDEVIKWVSALRRATAYACASPRSPPRSDDAGTPRSPTAVDAPNALLIERFAFQNPACAECGDGAVEWVSMAVGVTLCADCATLHRKLGADFSRLRALRLDKWSPLVLKYLVSAGGNEKANAVWESAPPSGWCKPSAWSALHVKETWVLAKYRWCGFITDERLQDPSRDMASAAREGDVPRLARAFAQRADANWRNVSDRGRSSLHAAAAAGRADAVAFLLLNGAAAHQLDDDDATPLCAEHCAQKTPQRAHGPFDLRGSKTDLRGSWTALDALSAGLGPRRQSRGLEGRRCTRALKPCTAHVVLDAAPQVWRRRPPTPSTSRRSSSSTSTTSSGASTSCGDAIPSGIIEEEGIIIK